MKVDKGIIDIHRLMVHPKHFRKGIAKILLNFVESNIEDSKTIIVSTGSKNIPAVTFYLKNGFIQTKETRLGEHLSLTSFKKDI